MESGAEDGKEVFFVFLWSEFRLLQRIRNSPDKVCRGEMDGGILAIEIGIGYRALSGILIEEVIGQLG